MTGAPRGSSNKAALGATKISRGQGGAVFNGGDLDTPPEDLFFYQPARKINNRTAFDDQRIAQQAHHQPIKQFSNGG